MKYRNILSKKKKKKKKERREKGLKLDVLSESEEKSWISDL